MCCIYLVLYINCIHNNFFKIQRSVDFKLCYKNVYYQAWLIVLDEAMFVLNTTSLTNVND